MLEPGNRHGNGYACAENEAEGRDLDDLAVHEAALLCWHRAESPLYNKLLETSDAREIRDAVVALRSVGLERPKELPDAKIITTIIAAIGRTQDRIRQAETVVTRDQMIRLFDRMAGVVRQYTDDETLQRIREGWMNLPREGR